MSDLHRPKKIHKTLVWGGWYGSRNIGDTAILLGIKELYSKINPDRHYYLAFLSTDVDYTNTNGVTGERALVKTDLFRPWRWLGLISTFRKVDLVIISGGTPIFDFSHAIRTLYMFLPLILRKQFILFGAGVKPIMSWYGKWYIPRVLKRAKYASVRDSGSLKILENVGLDKVRLTADSAFFAQPANQEIFESFLRKKGINIKEKLLLVAPRLMSPDKKRLYLDEDMGKSIIEETPKKLATAIDGVADSFDRVVFMAMHYYGPDSDVELIRQILSRCKTDKAIFIEEEMRPDIAISLFQHANVVLAMRLHALLLSSSMNTPIVGIAYEQKVKDLFKRLEIEEYVVDLFHFSDDELINTLKKTLNNRVLLIKHLAVRVSDLRELILKDASNVLRINATFSDK